MSKETVYTDENGEKYIILNGRKWPIYEEKPDDSGRIYLALMPWTFLIGFGSIFAIIFAFCVK